MQVFIVFYAKFQFCLHESFQSLESRSGYQNNLRLSRTQLLFSRSHVEFFTQTSFNPLHVWWKTARPTLASREKSVKYTYKPCTDTGAFFSTFAKYELYPTSATNVWQPPHFTLPRRYLFTTVVSSSPRTFHVIEFNGC